MSFGVDAAAARTSGELRVFTGRQGDMRRAVPLRQRFDDDRSGGHVDAERQRLSRVHHFDEAPRKQMFDGLFHEGQHAGVVGCDATHQTTFPGLGSQHDGILGRQQRNDLVDVALYLSCLGTRGEGDAGGEDLAHGILASRPREDERDGGQQLRTVERNQGRGARLATHPDLAVPRA